MAENFFGLTDTGRQRDNNEDAFIAQTIFNKQFVLACVIDGVGGYEGGEVAASIAKETILQAFKSSFHDLPGICSEALIAANEKIYKEKLESGKNASMACVATLAVVDSKNNKFYYAHVGDTRLYLYRDHSLVKISKDQSFVGFLEDSGRLSEDEAMKHPKRNEINNALGFDMQSVLQKDFIETGESPFLSGDIILLCSDGLTDMVGSKKIAAVLEKKTPLAQKANELIASANDAGGKDNITVVLVQNYKRPVKQEAKKPVLIKKESVENSRPVQKTIPVEHVKQTTKPKRKSTGIIAILSVLCLLFLSGFIWLWWKQHCSKSIQADLVKMEKNVQEIRLQTFINASQSDTILLNNPNWSGTISLTDTIWVRRDSLYLKGSNTTLLKDSSAATAVAIMIAPNCKHIVLDSLTLQNFSIGIMAANQNALQLKNIMFKNCAVGVSYNFPDGLRVNGRFVEK
ncbi:MAG: PP2C family protein-serine/threonine phosphatase [Flavisolibacter sp.]